MTLLLLLLFLLRVRRGKSISTNFIIYANGKIYYKCTVVKIMIELKKTCGQKKNKQFV